MQKVKWSDVLSEEKTEDHHRQQIQHLEVSEFGTNHQTKAETLQIGVDAQADDQTPSEVRTSLSVLWLHPSFLPFRFLLGLFVFILHDFIIPAVKINSHFSFSLNAQLCHLKMKSTPFPLLLRAHTHVLYTSPGCFCENQ